MLAHTRTSTALAAGFILLAGDLASAPEAKAVYFVGPGIGLPTKPRPAPQPTAPAPVTPAPSAPVVSAGPASCIRDNVVATRRGFYVAAYVTYTNTCGHTVKFYTCAATEYYSASPGPCAYAGDFSEEALAAGASWQESLAYGGQYVVQVAECPYGYTWPSFVESSLPCVRG